MTGREEKSAAHEQRLLVDATLEGLIAQVEQSVAAYISTANDGTRQSLVVALEQLDAQTEQSDAYENSVIGSAALGYASKGEVVGETSIDSVVDEVPSSELTAQLALVRAAKAEVRGPGPATFASLQAASASLAATRSQQN
jgi:hypothetical protein